MTHTPHELTEEFPDKHKELHDLKVGNPHAARLFEEYHELNREIHRAETDVSPTDDFHMAEMRKKRLALKDEIAGMLNG